MGLIERMKTAIDSLTLGEKVLGSLQVALFGMAIVFSILVFIMIAITLLEKFAGDSKKSPSRSISTEETTMDEKTSKEALVDYGELVAVITAAVAASLHTSSHNIVVKNITRVPDVTPVWGKAGRIQQLN